MVFSSLIFVSAFLPLTVMAYLLAPAAFRNAVLVTASLFFYAWGEPIALFVVIVSVAVNFWLGLSMAAQRGVTRRTTLIIVIAINLAVLFVFKYLNFVIENLNFLLAASGAKFGILSVPIRMPIGISFYTFHILSYMIDVYRGTTAPQASFARFALYIVNFPQMVAGPIIRYKEIDSQLGMRPIILTDFEAGIYRFVTGLAKKLLIADPIAGIADLIFNQHPDDLSFGVAWLGVVCYALQIYFDFSGYSDMAIGIARMFGFRFPENFDQPYTAQSMRDFWRRWHMSLSRWFRDYLYIPLGGSKGGWLSTAINLWIVFLLTGIWHGASWNFVIWGIWNGLFLSVERLPIIETLLARTPAVLRHAYVMIVVLIGWVFFRSDDLPSAFMRIRWMFTVTDAANAPLDLARYLNVQMAALIVAAILLCAVGKQLAERVGEMPLPRYAFVFVFTFLCMATMSVVQYNPFIYFRF